MPRSGNEPVRVKHFDKLKAGYVSEANGVETPSSFDFGPIKMGPTLRTNGNHYCF